MPHFGIIDLHVHFECVNICSTRTMQFSRDCLSTPKTTNLFFFLSFAFMPVIFLFSLSMCRKWKNQSGCIKPFRLSIYAITTRNLIKVKCTLGVEHHYVEGQLLHVIKRTKLLISVPWLNQGKHFFDDRSFQADPCLFS